MRLSQSLTFCTPPPEFPLPAESDHNSMLERVRDFSYDLPKTLSSALALLLTEVTSRLYLPCHIKPVNFSACSLLTSPGRRSFCAKARKVDFGTWSVSGCSHFSATLPLTLSSFRRNLSTSSSTSGITLIGRLPPREDLRTLTGMESFSLLTVTSFLSWAAWTTWATKQQGNECSPFQHIFISCLL